MITLINNFGSIQLRNPNYGDQENFEQTRINRRTRNNELKVYKDPIWPQQQVLKFDFQNLKEIDKDNLTQFVKETLGKDILLIDYKGRSWLGIIITPAIEFKQVADNCNIYETGFEFEGMIQEEAAFSIGFSFGFKS